MTPFQSGQSSFSTTEGPLNSPVKGASSVESLDSHAGEDQVQGFRALQAG